MQLGSPPASRPTRDRSRPHSSLPVHITQSLHPMHSYSTPTSSYRNSETYSTYPSTTPRHPSTPSSHPAVVDTYISSAPHHISTPTSRPAAVDTSAPNSRSFSDPNANMFSTSGTSTTDGIGYKSVIDKARATQKEDAELLHQAAKASHAHKLSRAKGERQRADEAAIRIASSSNLNIDVHYQQLLVEIKQNVKAKFEAEWIAEVREDVYQRYRQIASEYEAEIKDETYAFLVDSLEPVVMADLRHKLEPQIREELREELRAEMRSELSAESSAQHEARTPDCHQVHAGRGQAHSKVVQIVEETTTAVIDPSSSTIPTHIDTLDVNAGVNDLINHLDRKIPEEFSRFVREITAEVQGHESPLMDSVEREEEDGSATPYDNRYENQSANRSPSVGSKRSWSGEEDYEENESPVKRRKSFDEDGDEIVQWPFDDDPDTNDFQQQGSTSPPSSNDYFDDSEDEEHQDVITPGPFVQLAPQFVQPGCLIAQTNTADDAWIIDDSDDEEGIEGEVENGGTLVETGFVAVNKAGVDVRANELFLSEGNDR